MRKRITSIDGDYSRAIEPPPSYPSIWSEFQAYRRTRLGAFTEGAIVGVLLFIILGEMGVLG